LRRERIVNLSTNKWNLCVIYAFQTSMRDQLSQRLRHLRGLHRKQSKEGEICGKQTKTGRFLDVQPAGFIQLVHACSSSYLQGFFTKIKNTRMEFFMEAYRYPTKQSRSHNFTLTVNTLLVTCCMMSVNKCVIIIIIVTT